MSQPQDPASATPDLGVAGASARREGERRKANRERRVREKHPRLGGVILALAGEPEHEQTWAFGAGGEEHVAARLAKRLGADAVLLHDRRIRGSRANIDHIAIASSGVWVIDTKRYKGKVAVANPLFGQPKLTIAGRDKSRLANGLAKQVDLVQAVIDQVESDLSVRGVLCFVDAELPWLGTLSFRGFQILHPERLARRIGKPGPVTSEAIQTLAAELAQRFLSA